MKKIIIFFLVLLFSVWLGLKISGISGYVLISYKDSNIAVTTWFAAIVIILSFLLFHIVLRLLYLAFVMPKKIRKVWRNFRIKRIYLKTAKAVTSIIEGDYNHAEKKLRKIARKKQNNIAALDYIAAAFAANKRGDLQKSITYLDLANKEQPESAFLAGLVKAQFLIKNTKWDESLLVLKNLHKTCPKHKLVLNLLQRVYVELKNWRQLFYLLPTLQTYKVLNKQDFSELQLNTYEGLLKHYIAENDKFKAEHFWRYLPKRFKKEPRVMLPYLKYLYSSNEENDREIVEKTLYHTLHKSFATSLIEFYCTIPSKKPIKQLKTVENWLTQYGDNTMLLLSIARLCKNLTIWGKAKYHLEKALEISPSAAIYNELAITMEKQGDNEKAYDYYRRGLEFVVNSTNLAISKTSV
jgi:HemY protein